MATTSLRKHASTAPGWDRKGQASSLAHPQVERHLWSSGLSRFLPELPYASLGSKLGKLQLCTYLQRYGLGVLRGVPAEEGMVAKVGNEIGHVRVTNYGSIFDVRDKGAEANNLAFTSQAIRAHTDNPYRDPYPGVQMLHCLQSAEAGGATLFIDGFRIAEELRRQDPEAFRLLASTPHPFEYRDPDEGVLLRATAPVIQLGPGSAVERVTFNNRSAAALPASFSNFEEPRRLQQNNCKSQKCRDSFLLTVHRGC